MKPHLGVGDKAYAFDLYQSWLRASSLATKLVALRATLLNHGK